MWGHAALRALSRSHRSCSWGPPAHGAPWGPRTRGSPHGPAPAWLGRVVVRACWRGPGPKPRGRADGGRSALVSGMRGRQGLTQCSSSTSRG
jgi:hypothetical protein